MGKPTGKGEGRVHLKDFEAVVKGSGGSGLYSAHEIKRMFATHARDPPEAEGSEPYIPVREFKSKFLPSLAWTKEREELKAQDQASEDGGSDAASGQASVDINDVLAGGRGADLAQERREQGVLA
jgi:hypothetical protein